MPFLTLNGVTIKAEVGAQSSTSVEVGRVPDGLIGKPRPSRVSVPREWSCSAGILQQDELEFLIAMMEGEYVRIPFDVDAASTCGYVEIGAGSSVIIQSASSKVGIGYLDLQNSSAQVWDLGLRVGNQPRWSCMYWRATANPPVTWQHVIENHDGTTYLNGAPGSSYGEVSVDSAGQLTLDSSVTNVAADELVVFRAPITAAIASEVYAWMNAGNAWPDSPYVEADGDMIWDGPVTCLAEIGRVSYLQGTPKGASTWDNALSRLAFTLLEYR